MKGFLALLAFAIVSGSFVYIGDGNDHRFDFAKSILPFFIVVFLLISAVLFLKKK